MQKFKLILDEIIKLHKQHKFIKGQKAAYKINAFILLVAGLIVRNYASNYKVSGVEKLINTNYKSSTEAQEEFIQCYKVFLRNKDNNEAIFCVAAVHTERHTIAAYSWLKRDSKIHLSTLSGSTYLIADNSKIKAMYLPYGCLNLNLIKRLMKLLKSLEVLESFKLLILQLFHLDANLKFMCNWYR